MTRDGAQDARVVGHAELVRHGEQHRVRLAYGLVRRQFGGDGVRLPDIGPAEPGPDAVQQPDPPPTWR
jgi:hypothetical protein